VVADGFVEVIFRYEPAAGARAAGGASLFWLGKRSKDGTQQEVKYTEIPAGLRVLERTHPGDCWRVRHAVTGALLLDKHCATIEGRQEVVIS